MSGSLPLREPDRAVLERALRATALAGGELALYCDRSEHVEDVGVDLVHEAGKTLRAVALDCASGLGLDVIGGYAQRLQVVEQRRGVIGGADYDGPRAALRCVTWADLQDVQLRHDRAYHLDIVGLSRFEQLRHCTLHVAKLTGRFARALSADEMPEDVPHSRVPDLLIFGLKVASICGQPLPATAVVRADAVAV